MAFSPVPTAPPVPTAAPVSPGAATSTAALGSGRATVLVAAARALVTETGTSAFTVAEVARRAGVSLKGFYATYRAKDDLLVALLAADSEIGAALVDAAVGAAPDPEAKLRAWIRGICDLAARPEARGYAWLLAREVRRLADERPASLEAALAVWTTRLRDLVAAVGSSDPDRDARIVFALVIDTIHEVTRGLVDLDDHPDHPDHPRRPDHIDHLGDFVLRALAGTDRRIP